MRNPTPAYVIKKEDLSISNVDPSCIGSEITFCLKELKAALLFCEAQGRDVNIFFERSGKPILISSVSKMECGFSVRILLVKRGKII